MAPCGHIYVHRKSDIWREDYADAGTDLAGLFVHELTHVWQWQRGVFLPLARHPLCRYDYVIKPGWRLHRYGLEQQAEIVRHAWLLRQGRIVPGAPSLDRYETLLSVFS
jgi:hypothetical protein